MATNDVRALRVANFVLVYKERYDHDEDYETSLSDLITDLFHFAVLHDVDWNRVLERSLMHLRAELAEREDPPYIAGTGILPASYYEGEALFAELEQENGD